jgi:signal peptidase II
MINNEGHQLEEAGVPEGAAKWLWLALVVVVIDQATKFWASLNLQLYDPLPVIPSLNLTLLHNTGAAFSFLNEAGGWQQWLFILLAVTVSFFIVYWLTELPAERQWFACALSLVLGGALGNLWDRLALGYVIDFIDIYYGDWHWPAFNVADTAITVGALMLLLDAFRKDNAEEGSAG